METIDFKISIITVTYNAASFLEETILSVINQTYPNIEYIIIDGGSKDRTIDIIKKYEDKITYWISESDRGIYDAMNKGISMATGEWVNFMNAGDIFSSDAVLETVLNKSYPDNINFLYSDFYILSKNRRYYFDANFEIGRILHQSVIYKKKLHEIWGLYIITKKYIVSDYFFFMQIPINEVFKVSVPISINKDPGISDGTWTRYQKYCCDFLFYKSSVLKLIKELTIQLLRDKYHAWIK